MNSHSTCAFINRCFLFQLGIGIAANSFLLLFHIFTFHEDHRSYPTKLITCHLALVHEVMLFTAMSFIFMDLAESVNFWNELICKALFFTNRVMRNLSICFTCILSVIQAVTISPSTFYFVRCKHKLTNYILYVLIFFWFLNLSISSTVIFHVVSPPNVTPNDLLQIGKHCSISPMNSIFGRVFFIMTTSRDVLLVGVMLLSSVYMVILLSRHQKRCQYLHNTSHSPRSSLEKRATQTILLLVSAFVDTYCLNLIIMTISVHVLWTYDQVFLSIQKFVSNVYATVNPLVLLSSDKRIINILKYMQCKSH
ncbi:putative vomeronasal receptor-like protein 4 [Oryctolagus cuniculus]|uniref:putative vomeronasal receptor-like protein 4 n=1 Tax=Oryctolagus cuniculus TaxID=9986 RepID=UPI003879F587